jgi:hypothetical protein
LRSIKKQLEAYNELLKGIQEDTLIVARGRALVIKLSDWETNIVETRQTTSQDFVNYHGKLNAELLNLKALADVHDPRVTKGQKERLSDLEREWLGYKIIYETDLKKSIAAYNDLFREQHLPALKL